MSIPIKDNHNNIIDHKLPMAQDPIIPISSTLISNYINDPNNKPTDLIDWFIKWTNVPTRKSAIWKLWKSNHLQDILLISLFQSSSSSSSGTTTNYNTFINLIYTLKVRFIKAKNKNVYDVNLFNTIMFGNLIRDIYFNQYKTSPDRATQIIKNSWNSINPHKSDQTGMTNLLLQVLTQRFKMDPFTSLNGVNILFPLNLPSYVSGDNKTRFLLQNKCNYIMARSLIDKLGEKHGISLDSDQINNLKKFITQYQRIIPGDSIDPFESLFKHIST